MNELFLLARIAGRGVAIPADQVVSGVDIDQVVAIPRTVPCICGLAALRSRVVTVVDTARALGLAQEPGIRSRAVITKVDGHEYAFLVDALDDVVPLERQPLSSGLALNRGWAAVGAGMVEHDGEPLLVLDITALVPAMANAV